jgi:hypothetical protein
MPATSHKQESTARVAMGIKHGDIDPADLPEGLRTAALSMAEMSESSLKDYMHMAKHRPKKKSLLGGSE